MSVQAKLKFGSHEIYCYDDMPEVLFFTSRMHVDADGSPRAYHPHGSPPGLDYLANAGSPGNWWGIVSHSGQAYIQDESQVYPGFHISTTALEHHAVPETDPAHWVDSEKVPFLVLPSRPNFGAHLGDIGMCFNLGTGKSSWFIYADIGPANQIGEGSIALNTALGLMNPKWTLDKNVKNGGTEKEEIVNVLFLGSSIGWPVTNDALQAQAGGHMQGFGGLAKLKSALSRLDWSKF